MASPCPRAASSRPSAFLVGTGSRAHTARNLSRLVVVRAAHGPRAVEPPPHNRGVAHAGFAVPRADEGLCARPAAPRPPQAAAAGPPAARPPAPGRRAGPGVDRLAGRPRERAPGAGLSRYLLAAGARRLRRRREGDASLQARRPRGVHDARRLDDPRDRRPRVDAGAQPEPRRGDRPARRRDDRAPAPPRRGALLLHRRPRPAARRRRRARGRPRRLCCDPTRKRSQAVEHRGRRPRAPVLLRPRLLARRHRAPRGIVRGRDFRPVSGLDIRMPSLRTLAILVALGAALGCAAPAQALTVGIADNKPDMFFDPRFAAAGISQARLSVGWDALTSPWQTQQLDHWLHPAPGPPRPPP